MNNVVLGRTGIEVRKQSFGCLPIQRLSKAEAVKLLRQAAEGGMNFFDTARAYTDSEEKFLWTTQATVILSIIIL